MDHVQSRARRPGVAVAMRGEHHDRGQLSPQMASTLKRFQEAARKLPPSDETWLRVDIEIGRGPQRAFSRAGLIKKIERKEHTTKHYWKTTQGVYDWIQRHIETQTYTPCGKSTGIRTIEPGTYTCTHDDCECRMSRDEAEEVIV